MCATSSTPSAQERGSEGVTPQDIDQIVKWLTEAREFLAEPHEQIEIDALIAALSRAEAWEAEP